jgi:hypothetical protein
MADGYIPMCAASCGLGIKKEKRNRVGLAVDRYLPVTTLTV